MREFYEAVERRTYEKVDKIDLSGRRILRPRFYASILLVMITTILVGTASYWQTQRLNMVRDLEITLISINKPISHVNRVSISIREKLATGRLPPSVLYRAHGALFSAKAKEIRAGLARLDKIWPQLPVQLQDALMRSRRNYADILTGLGPIVEDDGESPKKTDANLQRLDGFFYLFNNQVIQDQQSALFAVRDATLRNQGRFNAALLGMVFSIMLVLYLVVFRPLETKISSSLRALDIARRKAQSADRAKSAFLANMSHELRTPLNGILGTAALLKTTELNNRQSLFVQTITDSGALLLDLVNDVLDLSKIEAGHSDLINSPFKLAKLFDQLTSMLAPMASRRSIRFNVNLDSALPQVIIADSRRLNQIITNLCSNAIKFTDEGEVALNATGHDIDKGYMLKIEVKDTGIGIPPEQLSRIFERFSRVHQEEGLVREGTGLGLSVTAEIVRMMQGDISVESEQGNGSIFRVSLPVRLPDDEILDAEVVEENKTQPDDMAGMQEPLGANLSSQGQTIR